jgi:hypothetical protein
MAADRVRGSQAVSIGDQDHDPPQDRSSTESGSRSAISLCRKSAKTGREQMQQQM